MKEQFISDKVVIVNLQNLRWVRKNNQTTTSYRNQTTTSYRKESSFDIDLCYNVKLDPVMSIKYKKEKDRDAMYDRIAKELTTHADAA